MKNKFTFIDLFAGIGGFRIALANLGGQCINFSEINVDAINTYCSNFSEDDSSNLGDITKISALPEHDLLTAGVPCQSWSIAGKNLGFDDDRGQLWNDTIYLLHQAKPKAFIFENVKGLSDPRNSEALSYILKRIKDAGYFANYYILNSYDYGVPQNRVRIYIVGFKDKKFHDAFKIPLPHQKKIRLGDIIDDCDFSELNSDPNPIERDLFGEIVTQKRSMSLSNNHGFNDYFLFNDIRNGHTTIHSWDILNTTKRQKFICLLLLKNRRKSAYGNLDGNPLSLDHFKELDQSITQSELDELIQKNILKKEDYSYKILKKKPNVGLTDEEELILSLNIENMLIPDILTSNRELKLKRISVTETLCSLLEKKVIINSETRYDFKFTKISTGLFGINRIFLPTSNIFPTLVASDSNDFITTIAISAENENDYKNQFIKKVYNSGNYRKITRQEACKIQGFPDDFILPDSRSRWMKLIGNSVSVPVVEMIGEAILKTGIFLKKK